MHTLLCVTAHPDDESMGFGGALAMAAADGVVTHVLCATRGERGWTGPADDHPGFAALGRQREAELRAAAEVLGVRSVSFLGLIDGEVDQADQLELIAAIVRQIRLLRPQVVLTFGPDGAYGHPDHIAISQATTAALVAAADPRFDRGADQPPHRVSKLYWYAMRQREADAWRQAFGTATIEVDGEGRGDVTWPDWAITTVLDTRPWWRQVWQAVSCHTSQLPTLRELAALPAELHERLWGVQTFYRAFSLTGGGREVERDLFAGLHRRVPMPAAVAAWRVDGSTTTWSGKETDDGC